MRNGPYLGSEAKIDKSKTTFLSQTFKVGENKVPLLLYILAYFPRYGHIMDSTLLLQLKSILQYIFPNFDRKKEFCKKKTLFLILKV